MTGATGFLGRHVIPELTARGHDVVALVRDPSNQVGDAPSVRLLRGDLVEPKLPDRIRNCRVDHVMHLAWSAVRRTDDSAHLQSYLPIHTRFLKGLVDVGVVSLSVSGSCFEYGPRQGELTEQHSTRADSPYGEAKNRLREELQRIPGLSLMWARFFYVYGPGQESGSLFGSLSGAILRGEPSFRLREPATKRDFIPVEVATRLFCSLATGGCEGVFNVCSGVPRTTKQVAEEICVRVGSRIHLQGESVADPPDTSPSAFWGSNAKARAAVEKDTTLIHNR